jgi:hypothetical protein
MIIIALWFSAQATAQDQHTLAFGSEKVTINCNARSTEGFCKTIVINSTVPLLVYFMKNDKSETNIMGKSVSVFYKKSDAGDDVADIVIDGNNWWSTRCLYYITVWTNAGSVNFDGTRYDLVGTLQFEQVGFPFSVSKLATTESN